MYCRRVAKKITIDREREVARRDKIPSRIVLVKRNEVEQSSGASLLTRMKEVEAQDAEDGTKSAIQKRRIFL